jgi:hypothetical protein
MIYGSTYERFFGKYHEMNAGDAEILKFKKLSELPLATYLNQKAISYIEDWILLKDDDFYASLVIFTLRNIYTYLKSIKPKITRYTE